jgi:hypothetical protein
MPMSFRIFFAPETSTPPATSSLLTFHGGGDPVVVLLAVHAPAVPIRRHRSVRPACTSSALGLTGERRQVRRSPEIFLDLPLCLCQDISGAHRGAP